uniref:Uncharacterized protein n=1 Tax=Nothobranchius furzeri TaxID=105023 RepID=A0A1A8A7H3_NOTFU
MFVNALSELELTNSNHNYEHYKRAFMSVDASSQHYYSVNCGSNTVYRFTQTVNAALCSSLGLRSQTSTGTISSFPQSGLGCLTHSCHQVRGRGHPGQVSSPFQGHRDTLACRDSLESPVNLAAMFLVCGRKLKYLKKTHPCMRRTC